MTVETPPIRVRIVGATDVGLVREHNEDNFLIVDLDTAETDFSKPREYELGRRGALLVVCDGMGGAAAGEVASSMAVESMRRQMLPADSNPPSAPGSEATGTPSSPGAQAATGAGAATAPAAEGVSADAELQRMSRKLRDAATRANQEIYEAACADIAKAGMGTTLTALLLLKTAVVVAQVGDSRAYVLRQGKLTQITHDQSLVNQLLDSGQITPEQAKLFEHSNVILQALGVQEDVEVVLSSENLRQGDRMLLCSDGLVGVVSDEEIQHIMSTTEDLGEAVRKLIEKARDGGGPDNITVILAEAHGDGIMAPGPEDLVQYRPLHLEGDRPPERRNWGADYGYAPAAGANRDLGPGTPPPRWLSPVTLLAFAAVLALVVTGLVVALVVLPPRSREVICRITSEPAGLLLLVDDRQIGPVQPGGIDVKLLPGERRLALHDPVSGARSVAHSFAVVAGQSCALVLHGPQPTPPIVTSLPDAARPASGDGGTAQDDLHPAEPVRDAGSPTAPSEPDAGVAKPGEAGQPGQPGSTVTDGTSDEPGPPQNRNNKRGPKRRIRRPGTTETPGTPPDSGTPTKPETSPGGTPDQGVQGTSPPATPVTPPSTTSPTPGAEGQGTPKAATGGPADKPAKPADKPATGAPADKPADKPAAPPSEKPATPAPSADKPPAPAPSPAP